MLKLLIVLHALCGAPNAEAPVCKVRWATMPNGVQSVSITGHHGDDVVICRLINTSDADCRVTQPSQAVNRTRGGCLSGDGADHRQFLSEATKSTCRRSRITTGAACT